ncbi:MAG: AMP-binding protein [Solirubrobacterales bacterium]|nr:AMP-binding protein [Solirubrobacterales bacterium]
MEYSHAADTATATAVSASYAHGTSQVPLLGETIGANLDRTVARWPERPGLVSRHQALRWTYAELGARVDGLAGGLLAAGIAKGDRVGIWSPNCAEWTLVQYATAKIGAVLVNLNPAYRTHELAYALRQSGIRLLVAAPVFKTSDYRAMVGEVRGECPALEQVVFLESPEWDQLAQTQPDADALAERAATLSCDDAINIQYTSGTTGFPKGATLSHHNILNNGFFVGELCSYTAEDRVCIPVPFYHCFGMVMGNLACTSHGALMVIPAPSFEPEATLAAVAEERCTSLYGVPTMFIAELEHPGFAGFDLSSLRTGIMAGSPCPIEVMRRVVSEMHMSEVSICYGMTETSPVSTQTRRDDELERRVTTVGRPGPHIEVKVVDPVTGLTVARGEPGEFCTRGYSVMLGYWEDAERSAEAIDTAGWMHTGDLATMDDDGYCKIVGRIKDMVIRGGENVYPREIEEFLYGHPDIADVQVVGVPDRRFGEELCAWVRLREGAGLTDEDVRGFCRGRLAHFKVPRYVLFVEEFPMTVTGKIQKFKMREASIARLSLHDAAHTETA